MNDGERTLQDLRRNEYDHLEATYAEVRSVRQRRALRHRQALENPKSLDGMLFGAWLRAVMRDDE